MIAIGGTMHRRERAGGQNDSRRVRFHRSRHDAVGVRCGVVWLKNGMVRFPMPIPRGLLREFFSWGNNLSFLDTQGNKLAEISQTLLSMTPTYEIKKNGETLATLSKDWDWGAEKFTLDVPGPNDFVIEGSFWTREYTFKRGNAVVAKVSKSYSSMTDSYGVDIEDGQDVVPILCTAVIIDQILDSSEKAAGR